MEQGDFLAREAIERFLGAGASVSLAKVPGGFSGGTVYRCITQASSYALKRWPQETSLERILEVHRVQQFVAMALPFMPSLVPLSCDLTRGESLSGLNSIASPATCLVSSGGTFELSRWMPGLAYSGDPASRSFIDESRDAVREGASAIARFHKRAELLGVENVIAPAVRRRWARLEQLTIQLPEAISAGSYLRGKANTAVSLLAKHWPQFQQSSANQLRPWLTRPVRASWVLRDIHREHIFFQGKQVSGMVDFDAVNHDTKATDLARWVGSFADLGLSLEPLWNAAIGGYRQQHEISTCEQELAGAIEKASWYILLANWVIWSSKKSHSIPGGLDAAERRIECLLRRTHAEECP